MKSVSFEGVIGGDQECFCWWNVPKKDKINLIGEQAYVEDVEFTAEFHKEMNEMTVQQRDVDECVKREMGQLYPNEVFDYLQCVDGKKYKFTISIEEIQD